MSMSYPDIDQIVQEARGGESRGDDRQKVEDEFVQKLRRAKVRFGEDMKALYRFMLDPAAPVHGKAVAIAALLYFISPLDAIPDVLPIVGFVDDAGVIAAAVQYLGSQLQAYRKRGSVGA